MKLKILFHSVILSGLCLTASAQVGLTPRTNVFSGTTGLTINNATTATVNSTAVPVYKARGLAIMPEFAAVSSSVSNVTFNFTVSADKVKWTTAPVLSYTLPLTGTTPVIGFTNLPPSLVDNVQWIRCSTIVNGSTANVVITNVLYSVYP